MSAPYAQTLAQGGLLSRPLLAWYDLHKTPHPWRQRWDIHQDTYAVWVSEVMLQQTLIPAVLKVYEPFLERFPTLNALAQAQEVDIKRAVQGLGYYRRFRFLHRAAQQWLQEAPSPGAWPGSYEAWLQLPGVGPYTAAAVSSITLHEPRAVVDGNVVRVVARLLDLRMPANHPRLVASSQTVASMLLDTHRPGDFNQAIMELGQKVCRPVHPRCEECPLQGSCLAFSFNSQTLAPGPKAMKAKVDVLLKVTIYRHPGDKGFAWMPYRPPGGAFLQDTPGFLLESIPFASAFAANTSTETKLGSFRHHITHHKIQAEVVLAEIDSPPYGGVWVQAHAMPALLVSSLDQKAWAQVASVLGITSAVHEKR